jgi:hypothetical protein
MKGGTIMIQVLFWAAAAVSTPSTAGCIDHSLDDCVSGFRLIYTLDDSQMEKGPFKPDVDVNGHVIPKRNLAMFFFWDGPSEDHRLATVELDSNLKVVEVDVSLSRNPESAQTEEEYAATGLASAFSAVAPSCFPDKIATFRFFENSIKPKIIRDAKETTVNELRASTSTFHHTPTIQVCGLAVQYSSLTGTDTEDISESNSHGYSAIYSLTFSTSKKSR